MKRFILPAMILAATLSWTAPATAGDPGEALGKCLVASSTGRDRDAIMAWLYVALSANPSVQSMSNITADERTKIDKDFAAVVDRLVLRECRAEAVAALKGKGSDAFETAFSQLGEIAVVDLMQSPDVDKAMSRFTDHIDTKAWEALTAEAAH